MIGLFLPNKDPFDQGNHRNDDGGGNREKSGDVDTGGEGHGEHTEPGIGGGIHTAAEGDEIEDGKQEADHEIG